MTLYQATFEDDDAILAFYDDVTARTPDISLHARWSKGKHPTTDGIRAYIKEGSMFLYKEQDVIVGAMALTMYQGDDYHAIEWSQQVPDDEVAVIHILAVHPDRQGSGVGSEMVREAIRLARKNGMKAVRLDALASNTPAHSMYKLWASNTGASSTSMQKTLDGPTSISLSSEKAINQLTIIDNDNERSKFPYPIRLQHHWTIHPRQQGYR